MQQDLKQDMMSMLSKERKRGFRLVVYKHPECPYKDCGFNQCYITPDDLDMDICYIDIKCQKYLDT